MSQVRGWPWPGATERVTPGMELLERQKAVADAILLERAAGVLGRRKHHDGQRLVNQLSDEALEFQLRKRAIVLRAEAEHDDSCC